MHGKVEIHYGSYVLRAEEVTYNTDTREATADGNVVLLGSLNDERIQASHARYNFRSETGHFEQVHGTLGMRPGMTRAMLTSPNPFILTGKVVEKTSPDHYVLYGGTVTTCNLPHPKWRFYARKVTVDVGGNAQIYNSDFRIMGVPILYLPYATHPVEKVRQSGLEIPNIGTSSIKGKILGESAYWAINRSMDLNGGAQYYSLRGWAPHAEFRARPSDGSFIDVNYGAVFDRKNQGGQEFRVQAENLFPHNFRGVVNTDYLTSYVYRLAFSEVFTQAVNSEVKSQGFLTNASKGFFNNFLTERYQNFESTTAGDVVTIVHAPTLEASSVDRPLGHSPFYWSYDASAGGLYRSEPGFATAPLVGRLNLNPRISLPLLFHGWSLRPEISLRDTFYTEQLVTSGNRAATSDPINRKSLESSVELRPPALDRVFNREFLGRKWKHVIEPRAVYRYVTGVNNFSGILRFDDEDIMSNTDEVEYAVVNRLYAKRTSPAPEDCGPAGMPGLVIGSQPTQSRIPWEQSQNLEGTPCQTGPEVREIVTWELAQKYYLDPTFGGALVPGVRNVFAATADLTGIAFLSNARRLSPLVSRLRIQTTSRTDAEWDLDYDVKKGRINASTAVINYRFGLFTVGGGDAFLQSPSTLPSAPLPQPQRFDQYRLLLGYGHLNKRGFTGAANIGFDAHLDFLQYASAQAAYNWDCCGINIEYRRFALGAVRNENQFRFTFALANLGAIGNLKRQERLF